MKKADLLTWRGQFRNGFLIIQNHDIHAGFGALILYALNGIRKAEAMNAIPVIDFNTTNCPYFFSAEHGDSIWDYFFESVSPYTHEMINEWIKTSLITTEEVAYITSEEAAQTHQHDPDRLATFWAWEAPEDKALWMKDKRVLGRQYVQEYVRPKADIEEKVRQFTDRAFTAGFIIGVHIRGTDFAYAEPTPPASYFDAIDQLITQGKGDWQIFVATDQQQFLSMFQERYGTRVIHQNATRSENHIAPFRFDRLNGYLKGEEVLLDMLLLSKCHHVIKGAAAVGELALWFSNHSNITDFALQSEFNSKEYDELQSTFAQMNVAGKNDGALRIHRSREQVIRKLIESRIGKALYYRSALIRKILKH